MLMNTWKSKNKELGDWAFLKRRALEPDMCNSGISPHSIWGLWMHKWHIYWHIESMQNHTFIVCKYSKRMQLTSITSTAASSRGAVKCPNQLIHFRSPSASSSACIDNKRISSHWLSAYLCWCWLHGIELQVIKQKSKTKKKKIGDSV